MPTTCPERERRSCSVGGTDGFSAAERAAMKKRAAELRAEGKVADLVKAAIS